MRRRLLVIALCLLPAAAWSLDAPSQKLADRYLIILRTNPGQATALDRLWKLYDDAGETAALIELAKAESAKAPVFYARVLQRAGKTGDAETFLRESANSGSAAAALMYASVLETNKDFAGAAEVLEKAAASEKDATLLLRLGELWSSAGQLEKSRAAWEQAVALAPDDLVLRKKLARGAAQAGDLTAAVAHLRIVAEKGSPTERFSAWEDISRDLEQSADIPGAIEAQESLLALMGPGHWQLPAARRRLLSLHERAGSLDGVEKLWREQAAARPRDPDAALRLAQLYDFKSDDIQRLEWLRKASDLLPKDAVLATETASLELSLGHPEAAAALYDRVLELRPQDEDVIFLRAEASVLNKQEDDAIKRTADLLAARKGDENTVIRAREFYRRLRLSAPLERMLSDAASSNPKDEAAALELAHFYLDESRYQDAATVMSRFDDAALSPADSAAVAFRFSNTLRDAGMKDEALGWARRAFEKVPSSPEYALHLADLLTLRDDQEGVRSVLEQAASSSSSSLPREDVDRRLFLALQNADQMAAKEFPGSGRGVRDTVESLSKAAADEGKEEAWLRLARWRRWSEGTGEVVASLREGVERHPESLALREALAVALSDFGQPALAIVEFRKLAAAQPDKAPEYQRRIGNLQLDAGMIDEGLATFEALAAAKSADWKTASDLALAEQRAGNWFRAVETWQRASRAAPADALANLIPPFLNAVSRLQLYDRGLDFLEEQVASERDASAREQLLREAARFAKQNTVTDDWRAHLDRRIKAAPAELHWKLGMVYLLEEEGRTAEARQYLIDSRQGEDSQADLEVMLAAAEKAGDFDEAARLLKRLISLSKSPDPSLAIKRADYLERAGRIDDARQAWENILARHARVPAALTSAAEFFERVGDETRMEAAYRAAAALGGCPPQVLLRLGRLALERGDRIQALEDFEAVLRSTQPDAGAAKDCLPLPERILNSRDSLPSLVSFLPGGARTRVSPSVPWKRVSEKETEGCRLLAIEQAAGLLANSPEKSRWVQGFSEPIEKIWASWYAGEAAEAFHLIEGLFDNGGPAVPALEQGAAALAMESAQSGLLAAWATANAEDINDRWDNILAALNRMLEASWRPSEDEILSLFRSAPALKRWQAARAFAARQLFRNACVLGETVPENMSPAVAASAWLELAGWRLALRDTDASIACLDRAIAISPPSTSYADPLFAAIRSRWLLTPESRRGAFVASLEPRWKALDHPGSEAAARALLATLQGDPDLATVELRKLFAGLGATDQETWGEVVQQSAARLEEWRMARLARDLYRNDLARDQAFLSLRGENFRRSSEGLFIYNWLVNADPATVTYLLNEWLAHGAGDEELVQAAARLQQAGRFEAAAQVLRSLCERGPRNDAVLAGLLSLFNFPSASVADSLTPFLRTLLSDMRLSPSVRQNAAFRLSSYLEESGDFEGALAVIDRLPDDPRTRPFLVRRVQLLSRMGKFREALEALETGAANIPPAGPPLSVPLADLYFGFGRDREARALLEKTARGATPEKASAVARLRELAGGPSARPRTSPVAPEEWARVLRSLDEAYRNPEDRFKAGSVFLSTNSTLPGDLRNAELARLKRMATRNPDLLPSFYLLRKDLGGQPGQSQALEKELLTEWNSGRGSYLAGEILIQIYLEQHRYDELAPFLGGYLTDRNFNEQAWDQIGRRLLAGGRPELAARVMSALMTRSPGDTSRALTLASALAASKRQVIANEIVAQIERIAPLDTARYLDLAQYAVDQGRIDKAREYLLAAMTFYPNDSRTLTLWGSVARELIKAGRPAEAREALSRVSLNPQVFSPQVLADYYAAAGGIQAADPAGNEFNLPPRLLRDFRIEMLDRLVTAGNAERAWVWLEGDPLLFQDFRARKLLQAIETTHPDRAARLWEIALQVPLWEIRTDAAQFYLRRALAAAPADSLKDLLRAHELNPGSFEIAKACASEYLRQKKPVEARKVLQDVIAGYAQPADRRAARDMLASLQASPALPGGG